jgi:hypothetical protein
MLAADSRAKAARITLPLFVEKRPVEDITAETRFGGQSEAQRSGNAVDIILLTFLSYLNLRGEKKKGAWTFSLTWGLSRGKHMPAVGASNRCDAARNGDVTGLWPFGLPIFQAHQVIDDMTFSNPPPPGRNHRPPIAT